MVLRITHETTGGSENSLDGCLWLAHRMYSLESVFDTSELIIRGNSTYARLRLVKIYKLQSINCNLETLG
jgi:hypothetical protein